MSKVEKDSLEAKASLVLDDRTGELTYRVLGSDFGMLKDPAEKRLEEMMRTPLTDLGVINERLDSIGDLVNDGELRKGFGKVVKVFNPFWLNSIYDGIKELLSSSPYTANHAAESLRASIKRFAEETKEFPASLGGGSYTKTICGLVSEFNDLMTSPYRTQITDFFCYMAEVNGKLSDLETAFNEKEGEKKHEAEKLNNEQIEEAKKDFDSFSNLLTNLLGGRSTLPKHLLPEEPPFLKWLTETVDFEKLISFKQHLERTLQVYFGVYPYLKLAEEAVLGKYVRPEVVPREENCLIIKNGRWEAATEDAFSRFGGPSLGSRSQKAIPNSTSLNKRTRVEVLEGVNDGGKTFDMCKSMYIAARALAGSWVPAEYARVSIMDQIIMRMKGTGNTISALQQDCKSTSEVMPPPDEYWLIGMDETFRSTEAHGGEALTAGLINTIRDQGKSLMIVSSHYPDLHCAYTVGRRVRFRHFPFKTELDSKEDGGIKVTFPHVKLTGPQKDYSYAIAVARVNGFNERVLQYAEERIKSRQNPAEAAKQ